jgi:hypothetical protein
VARIRTVALEQFGLSYQTRRKPHPFFFERKIRNSLPPAAPEKQ